MTKENTENTNCDSTDLFADDKLDTSIANEQSGDTVGETDIGVEIEPEQASTQASHSDRNDEPTPADISRDAYHKSQREYYDSKRNVFERFKTIITITAWFLGFAVTILTVIWGYSISSIAEPIGGIKEQMKNLKEQQDEIKEDIQRNSDNMVDFKDLILKNKFK